MRALMLAALCLSLVVSGVACQKSTDADATRQMPKLPPPPQVALPPALQIAVDIDGVVAAPIDAARLNALKPDFQDPERRAWRLSTLLGASVLRPRAVVAVTGDKDMTVLLRQPKSDKDPLPVLTESRRGGIVAAMIMPDDPFPPYHGQGRRLMRPGDPLPRISGVTRLHVYVEPPAPAAPAAPSPK
jgi:hypothetical protein